ncbi:MAG: hypothetical protein Q4F05_09475 [bacterium]|nr:hypothetical protein [bacterium]
MKTLKIQSVQIRKWRYAVLGQALLAIILTGLLTASLLLIVEYLLHLDVDRFGWTIEVVAVCLWGGIFYLLEWLLPDKDTLFTYYVMADFYTDYVEITDRKKRYKIIYDDIRDLSYCDILFGRGEVNPVAFKVYIKTRKRRYRLNSQLVSQEEYVQFSKTELMELYNELYVKSNLRF